MARQMARAKKLPIHKILDSGHIIFIHFHAISTMRFTICSKTMQNMSVLNQSKTIQGSWNVLFHGQRLNTNCDAEVEGLGGHFSKSHRFSCTSTESVSKQVWFKTHASHGNNKTSCRFRTDPFCLLFWWLHPILGEWRLHPILGECSEFWVLNHPLLAGSIIFEPHPNACLSRNSIRCSYASCSSLKLHWVTRMDLIQHDQNPQIKPADQ